MLPPPPGYHYHRNLLMIWFHDSQVVNVPGPSPFQVPVFVTKYVEKGLIKRIMKLIQGFERDEETAQRGDAGDGH